MKRNQVLNLLICSWLLHWYLQNPDCDVPTSTHLQILHGQTGVPFGHRKLQWPVNLETGLHNHRSYIKDAGTSYTVSINIWASSPRGFLVVETSSPFENMADCEGGPFVSCEGRGDQSFPNRGVEVDRWINFEERGGSDEDGHWMWRG